MLALSVKAQQAGPINSRVDMKPCVVVLGAVRSPARFEFSPPMRLLELVAMAGGWTERASYKIRVIHTASQCFQVERAQRSSMPSVADSAVFNLAEFLCLGEVVNPYVGPGDIVVVAESAPIYVAGAVFNPRAIYPKEQLTLTRAVAMARGVTHPAQTNRIRIYRKKNDSAEMIILRADLATIMKHRADDPVLQPYDIVEVPPNDLSPRMQWPIFDPRPLIPSEYRVIFKLPGATISS